MFTETSRALSAGIPLKPNLGHKNSVLNVVNYENSKGTLKAILRGKNEYIHS